MKKILFILLFIPFVSLSQDWGFVTGDRLSDSLAPIRSAIAAVAPGGNETDPVWVSQKSGYATLPLPAETDPVWSAVAASYATVSALNLKAPLASPTFSGAIVMNGAVNYAVDAQASDAYVITVTNITAYTAGMMIVFKAKTANTTGCTLNVNGLGAKTIVKRVSTTPATGDILANMFCWVVYDGTNFVILNPVVN